MKYLLLMILASFTITAQAQHFRTGSHIATSELKTELKKFYNKKIKDKTVYSLIIEGHTDIRGGDEYNQRLSERRANTALKELKLLGFKSKDVHIQVKGLGESKPISRIHGENRRIVLLVKSNAGSSVTVIREKCEPEVKEKIVYRKRKVRKNRVRLLGGYGPEEVEVNKKSSSHATLDEDKGLVLGLGYDRLLDDRWSIGGQIQTNETYLLNIGLDF